MNIQTLGMVALGGSIGSVLRYLCMIMASKIWGTNFPYGTLLVNVIGGLVTGILIEYMALQWSTSQEIRAFLIVGVMGGYTTFSAFSMDVVLMLERGEIFQVFLYVTGSVLLSVLALMAGLNLVRYL